MSFLINEQIYFESHHPKLIVLYVLAQYISQIKLKVNSALWFDYKNYFTQRNLLSQSLFIRLIVLSTIYFSQINVCHLSQVEHS